jgi:hypothetical protein
VDVDLVARVSVGALKVGHELTTQLRPGGEGPIGQVHELRPGHTSQGHREIVGHDDLISSCGEDQGGVDLRELGGIDTPIVLLQQVGSELAQPDHHGEVQGKHHTATPKSCQGA